MKKWKNQTKYTTWGFLRMVSLSTISRTTERCTAGRSAFSALNSVGLRFGCFHPVTSRRLYSTLCLPIVLHGSELWSLSNTKLNILECINREILAMHHPRPFKQMLNNSPPEPNWLQFHLILHHPKAVDLHKIINMQSSDLPKQILEVRITNPKCKGDHCYLERSR